MWSRRIVTALLVLFFVSLSDPHPLKHCSGRIWAGLHGKRTIEQRVQHIITHHPLLGKSTFNTIHALHVPPHHDVAIWSLTADLAHVSPDTMMDVLHLVKETNSVVMITFSPQFLSCTAAPPGSKDGLPEDYPPNATLSSAVDHILYIGNLIGFDHVGLGSDFDGLEELPEGLGDIPKFPDLVAEMLRRHVSDADPIKVVGGNALRVWGDVERVAKEMQASGEPAMEDWLEHSTRPPG